MRTKTAGQRNRDVPTESEDETQQLYGEIREGSATKEEEGELNAGAETRSTITKRQEGGERDSDI